MVLNQQNLRQQEEDHGFLILITRHKLQLLNLSQYLNGKVML